MAGRKTAGVNSWVVRYVWFRNQFHRGRGKDAFSGAADGPARCSPAALANHNLVERTSPIATGSVHSVQEDEEIASSLPPPSHRQIDQARQTCHGDRKVNRNQSAIRKSERFSTTSLPRSLAQLQTKNSVPNLLDVKYSANVLRHVVCQPTSWHTTPSEYCATIHPLPLAHHSRLPTPLAHHFVWHTTRAGTASPMIGVPDASYKPRRSVVPQAHPFTRGFHRRPVDNAGAGRPPSALLGHPCPELSRGYWPAMWPGLEESLWPFALQQMSLPDAPAVRRV